MQFDSTRIAIRERDFSEVMDLALQICWKFRGPLAAAFLVGVAPFALLNFALIGWMPALDFDEGSSERRRYLWVMAMLIFLEAPAATLLMTAYLGDALFQERASWRRAAAHLKSAWLEILWNIGLLRGIVPGILLAMYIPRSEMYELVFGPELPLLPLLCVLVLGARVFRPFLPEIILLERKRLRPAPDDPSTVGKRSRTLHALIGGDLMVRSIASAGVAGLLLMMFAANALILKSFLVGKSGWDPILTHIALPGAMWLVAGYFTVVRYLNYLDLRIRYEGWEVELRMRAEANRLRQRLQGALPRLQEASAPST